MPTSTITIDTILPGWSPAEYFSQKGQFLFSSGIDPEMPKDDSTTKPSGLLRPTAMAKFSGTEITGVPLWIENTNKGTDSFVYANDGKVHVINSTQTMGTALNGGAALTNAAGGGCAYYNNYIYFAKQTDVARYGPLNSTPALTQTFWTGSPMSKTALSNTTYPTINGVVMPNHPMYLHPMNNRLYFGDVNAQGVGIVSMINTVKGTYEGDTNSTVVPSSYNVLDTYYGYYPTCLSHLNTELAVGLIDGTSTTTKQKNTKVVFWSTVPSETSYNRVAELPDPIISAMKNVNGILYVFSGSATGGMRISRYLGGASFEEIYYSDDEYPVLAGAVDYQLNRVLFGSNTTTPIVSGCVKAIGSKSRALNMGFHNVLKATAPGTTPWVTAIKVLQQGQTAQPIVGWKDNNSYGLDKLSTTYGQSVWRSQIYSFGNQAEVKELRIPLAQAVGANQTLTVNLYGDDKSTYKTVGTINSTNYPSGDRFITLKPPTSFRFYNNFMLELVWSGTALMTVSTPISIIVEQIKE